MVLSAPAKVGSIGSGAKDRAVSRAPCIRMHPGSREFLDRAGPRLRLAASFDSAVLTASVASLGLRSYGREPQLFLPILGLVLGRSRLYNCYAHGAFSRKDRLHFCECACDS